MTKIDEMISYCERENVYYFCDLVKYASENRKDWCRVVSTENGSRIMFHYLADKAYRAGKITKAQYEDALSDV